MARRNYLPHVMLVGGTFALLALAATQKSAPVTAFAASLIGNLTVWPIPLIALILGALILRYRMMLAVVIGISAALIGLSVIGLVFLAPDAAIFNDAMRGIILCLAALAASVVPAHIGHAARLALFPKPIFRRQHPPHVQAA